MEPLINSEEKQKPERVHCPTCNRVCRPQNRERIPKPKVKEQTRGWRAAFSSSSFLPFHAFPFVFLHA
eukprot:264684-Amorphochlora_amoeboformis.AAC.1